MCESGSHSFVLWDRETGSNVRLVPYRCRSWRHVGACQRFKGAQDFVRVSEGILSRGDRWVYVVLTFNQRREVSEWDCYVAGVKRWQKLNQRLGRRFGRIEYVQTWEKHQSGFPHVNVVIHNAEIWKLCEDGGWRIFRQELKRHAIACGFGWTVPYVEPLRAETGMGLAGYLTKLSRELTGASVKNQVPVNAPAHFRRLRASRGLLSPVHHPGTAQGVMIPAWALSQVDLSREGIEKLIALRLAEAGAKSGLKKRGSHHE